MNKQAEDTIQRLQTIEQNLQQFQSQKQTFQSQVVEVDSALEELKKTDTAYKLVGDVLLHMKNVDLEKELNQRKEMATVRISSIEKQEKKLRDQAQELQKEVLTQMEKKK